MQSLPDVWGSGCDVAPPDVKGSRGRTACSDSVGPVNVVGLYILEARDGQPLPVLVYSSGSGDLFLTDRDRDVLPSERELYASATPGAVSNRGRPDDHAGSGRAAIAGIHARAPGPARLTLRG